MKLKRRLGQNFIVDYSYIKKLLSIANVKADDTVLEIGTGYGALTEPLCKELAIVTSYEIDRNLFLLAEKKLLCYKNLTLINGDGLKSTVKFTKLVSSLPYSISRRFIYWLLEKDFLSATTILQKDFVEKLVAKPSSRNYRAISVISQLSFKIFIFDEIPPEAFYPVPKVYSCIVKFEPIKPAILNRQLTRQINLIFTFRGKKVNFIIKHFLRKSSQLSIEIDSLRGKRIENLNSQECLTLVNFLSASIKAN